MNSSLSTVLDSSINFHKNLFEQGVSHSAVMQLIHKAGLDFGVEIHVEEFLKDPTMRHLSALISNPVPMSPPQPAPHAPSATPKTAALDDFLDLAKEANLGFAIEVDRDLFEQGATSLAILNLVQKAKRRYGIGINVEEFLKNPTLRYLGDLVRAKTRPNGHASSTTACEDETGENERQKAEGGILGILSSKQEKDAFLKRQLNLRQDTGSLELVTEAGLCVPSFLAKYARRMSQRTFEDAAVRKQELLRWLSCLDGVMDEGKVKYLYPSAGGTYCVQVYLEVKPGGIRDLPPGLYYYHPLRHGLMKISSDSLPSRVHFFYNRPHYEASRFCLYFVAAYEGIEPLYKKESDHFVSVETGAMVQLLAENQMQHGIGGCALSGIDSSLLKEALHLDASHRVLLGMVCGRVSPVVLAQEPPVRPALATFEDIAIVGIHGRFPGASNFDEYWENLKNQKISFSLAPKNRWTTPPADAGDVRGGFIDSIHAFDAAFFGIAPAEANLIDPQERLLLTNVYELMELSGYRGANSKRLGDQVGVFVGVMWNDTQTVVDELFAQDVRVGRVPFSSIANRISHYFDWSGPSLAVDTSCSSALTSIYLACQSLQHGDCRAAIAAGVNLFTHPSHLENLKRFHLIASNEASDTFGDQACGWIPGEGVGAVLLKPLSSAESDNDHIWGVIKGGSMTSGGRVAKYGMPSIERQTFLMRETLSKSNVSPDTVQYVEAAAAGSAIGDAAEIQAIQRVFTDRRTPLSVGTVKPNIGHLESASGISQLAKVLLQMKHRKILPVVPYHNLSPLIQLEEGSVEIVHATKDWEPADDAPLVAMINGFGGTGSYTNLLIQNYSRVSEKRMTGPDIPLIFALSAETEEQLRQYIVKFVEFLDGDGVREEKITLTQIVATLQLGRQSFSERIAILPASIEDLVQRLKRHLQGKIDGSVIVGSASGKKNNHAGARRFAWHQRQEIAQAWVAGDWGAWEEFYHDASIVKIPLPTYPFRSEEYRLDNLRFAHAKQEGVARTRDNAKSDAAGDLDDTRAEVLRSVEEFLLKTLGDLLRRPIDQHEIDRSFFDIGLSSADMVSLAREIDHTVGIKIPPSALFEHVTIPALAAYLGERHVAGAGLRAGETPPIEQDGTRRVGAASPKTASVPQHSAPIEVQPYSSTPALGEENTQVGGTDLFAPRDPIRYPLSEGQKGLWVLQKLTPEMSAYNCPICVRIAQRVGFENFKEACEFLVRQYPILTTVIEEAGGNPQQVIDPRRNPVIHQEDIPALTVDELSDFLEQKAKEPFSLKDEPLLRIHFFRRADEETIVLFCIHHLIFDGGSFAPLLGTFLRFCGELTQNRIPRLDSFGTAYSEFVIQEQTLLRGVEGERRLAYWKEELRGSLPIVELLTDRPRLPAQSFRGKTYHRKITPALGQRVRQFARTRSTYPSTLFLGVFKLLLRHYTGLEDIIIGMPVDVRSPDTRGSSIGYFINMIPIRSHLQEKTPFLAYLKTLQLKIVDGIGHSYPFPALVRELKIPANAERPPVFHLAFAYQNYASASDAQDIENNASFPIQLMREISQNGEYEILLEVYEEDGGFTLCLKYNPDLFFASTIVRMMEHYVKLLESAIDNPQANMEAYSLLSVEERHTLLLEWNDTKSEYPTECIHRLFEGQAASTPDAVAVVFGQRQLSYRELDAKASQLAHYLKEHGVVLGSLVGLCMERSIEMIVGLLGILKAGGAYVPIDPDYPIKRIQFVLQDICSPILLTQRKFQPIVTGFQNEVLYLDDEWNRVSRESKEMSDSAADPSGLAYVIYTSGSTGNPKGCMLSHAAVCNRILWMQDVYALDHRDRVLQKTPYSFDVSVWEFFWPLISGATLVFAMPDGHKDPRYLVRLIEEQGITTCHFVPSMLLHFVEEVKPGQCTTLTRLFTSGESLSYRLFEKASQKLSTKIHNLYGPTEAAVDVTSWEAHQRTDEKIPIGRPIANTQIYILRPDLEPTPIGIVGELHIGGAGLARGYLNQPELTEQKFIANPFDNENPRLYKTGDLARWLADGNIEYLGRLDQQVKIRGFRIELGEIEACLLQHAQIRESAVVASADVSGDKYLAAYFVPHTGPEPTTSELRSFLQGILPGYMVPSVFMCLPEFPLTPSGKLDRKALPNAKSAISSERAFIAPRTETEAAVAKIWGEILEIDGVGVHDNFFESGGHSLKAVSLISQISLRFADSKLTQVEFYREPTVEAVARILARETKQEHDLLPLLRGNEEATELSIICSPYAGASATVFQPLADALVRLNEHISVYAIALPGNEFGSEAGAFGSIESIAVACVEKILERVKGPIAIYGHCVGSFLALEIVRQLEERGREVKFLAVGAAFPFPRLVKYIPVDDPWRVRSDEAIFKLIRGWGGPKESIERDLLRFMIRNFRKDAKLAFQYEKRRRAWKIQAPIFNIVSADDRLTRNFTKRYLRWNTISEIVHLAVIKDGEHYFVGKKADVVADLFFHFDRCYDLLRRSTKTVIYWS